jgi:ATP synthase protein I
VYRIISVQFLVTVLVAGVASVYGLSAALSAVAGGLNSLVPNAYFARKVLGPSAEGHPQMMLGKWFRAEVGKLAMIVGLFVVAFAFVERLNVIALFSGFLCVHLSGVLASLFLDSYGGDQP